MATCPNCGNKTDQDYCQWCGYPIQASLQGKQKKNTGTSKADGCPTLVSEATGKVDVPLQAAQTIGLDKNTGDKEQKPDKKTSKKCCKGL